jgi:hypothetical protein
MKDSISKGLRRLTPQRIALLCGNIATVPDTLKGLKETFNSRTLGGRIYCTEDEISKTVLIAHLLELGELKLVKSVFDVNVQKMSGQSFDVQMGSDDNKVLSLKHKIKKVEGTNGDCQDLVLIDEAAGAAGKGEDKADVDMADRVALVDGAVLLGACSVLLCVKESGVFVNLYSI